MISELTLKEKLRLHQLIGIDTAEIVLYTNDEIDKL